MTLTLKEDQIVTVVWDTWLKPGMEEDTSSLSPHSGAAQMRTVFAKNTKTQKRYAGSPHSLHVPGSAG